MKTWKVLTMVFILLSALMLPGISYGQGRGGSGAMHANNAYIGSSHGGYTYRSNHARVNNARYGYNNSRYYGHYYNGNRYGNRYGYNGYRHGYYGYNRGYYGGYYRGYPRNYVGYYNNYYVSPAYPYYGYSSYGYPYYPYASYAYPLFAPGLSFYFGF
jgi:hypothetical protein